MAGAVGDILEFRGPFEYWRHTFVALPSRYVNSALAREVVAQLRNDGYVEEEVRGTDRAGMNRYDAGLRRKARRLAGPIAVLNFAKKTRVSSMPSTVGKRHLTSSIG